jgi:hypothetical protein
MIPFAGLGMDRAVVKSRRGRGRIECLEFEVPDCAALDRVSPISAERRLPGNVRWKQSSHVSVLAHRNVRQAKLGQRRRKDPLAFGRRNCRLVRGVWHCVGRHIAQEARKDTVHLVASFALSFSTHGQLTNSGRSKIPFFGTKFLSTVLDGQ